MKKTFKHGTSGILSLLVVIARFQMGLAQFTPFAAIENPTGVEVDANGYVHVAHLSSNPFSSLSTKLSSFGQFIGNSYFCQGFGCIDAPHLSRIPSSGDFIGVFDDGTLIEFNPNSGGYSVLGNLKTTTIDLSNMYDINAGAYSNLGGTVQPGIAHYGDVSVYETGNKLYLFISAVSAGIPFVIKITFENQSFVKAEVVLASSGVGFNSPNVPRGVAVNSFGTVLTTMPINPSGLAPYEVGIKFKYNFNTSAPPNIILNAQDIQSRGMCTDNSGNFYIATGPVGSSIAGSNFTGALVVLNKDLNGVVGVATFASISNFSTDVAVNSSTGTVYYCVSNHNMVYSVGIDDLHPGVLGNNDIGGQTEINIFPNPALDYLNVDISKCPPNALGLTIFDVTGKIMYSEVLDAPSENISKTIELSPLTNGLYWVQLKWAGGIKCLPFVKL